jgi:hypothetical protein
MRIEPGAVFEGYSRRVEREGLPDSDRKLVLPSLKSLRGNERSDTVASLEAGE